MLTKKVPKSTENFNCFFCDYNTSRKSHYERHIMTRKHKMLTFFENFEKKSTDQNDTIQSSQYFICECGKQYKHRQSLCVHKKKCNFKNVSTNDNKEIVKKNENVSQDTILKLVNENNDIKNLLLEQQKQIVEQQKQIGELLPKIGNTINNTANIKQKFNINIFLNEKCKDAINMNDFIHQIQLTLDNLDLTKNKGLSEGLSNIFIENMNKLSLYERPLHCTDTKRDTLYIKDNNNWERDKDKSKIKDAIKNLNKNHFKLINKWVNENPDFKDIDEKQNYFAHALKTCGASIDDISDKVVKKICTSTHLKDVLKDLDETIIE